MPLSFEDKNKVRQAFMRAIVNNPHADEPIPALGRADTDEPLTLRKLLISNLDSGVAFDQIEDAMLASGKPLDDIITISTPQWQGRFKYFRDLKK